MMGYVTEPSIATGTALDEFLPIYRALARPTRTHGPFSPDDVDRWDISAVATVLGIDSGDGGWQFMFSSWEQEYEDWKRSEGADVPHGTP